MEQINAGSSSTLQARTFHATLDPAKRVQLCSLPLKASYSNYIKQKYFLTTSNLSAKPPKQKKTVEEIMQEKIDAVENNMNDEIDAVENNMNDQIDAVENNMNDQIFHFKTYVVVKIVDMETRISEMKTEVQDIMSMIRRLRVETDLYSAFMKLLGAIIIGMYVQAAAQRGAKMGRAVRRRLHGL